METEVGGERLLPCVFSLCHAEPSPQEAISDPSGRNGCSAQSCPSLGGSAIPGSYLSECSQGPGSSAEKKQLGLSEC